MIPLSGVLDDLNAFQYEHVQKVRNQTDQACELLAPPHLCLMDTLASVLMRITRNIDKLIMGPDTVTGGAMVFPMTKIRKEFEATLAGFVIGVPAVEQTIREGRYLQALALLRQEMETLAQLYHLNNGARNNGRFGDKAIPSVGVLPERIRSQHDYLSGAVHVSKHHIVARATQQLHFGSLPELPQLPTGARYVSSFDAGLAHDSFLFHLWLLHGTIGQFNIYLKKYSPDFALTDLECERISQAEEMLRVAHQHASDTSPADE